ncbi:MAG TPA: DUF1579 family protein [Holophagaceae bacterium]|jgi:hypothetical protein|nr:DUF1579 family protein [Holophagaceae bacterium]
MRRTLVTAFGFSALALFAQQPAPAPAAAAPSPKPAAFEMPKPGPEMDKLKPLIGSFRVDQHLEASIMGPAGLSSGFSHVGEGPGGLSLIIDYTVHSGPMHGMKGHSILGWDGEAKTYKQVWTDSMAPMIVMSTGGWEGETFVMHSEGTMMGKAYKERDSFSGMGPDGFTLTIEMSMDGGPFQKAMTLIHHRLGEPAKPAAK